MPETDRLYRSTDVRLRGLVALLRDDHRLQAFAETELGRLLDHDARTGEDLLGLLRTHLDCSGSKTHTARLTGLSRPTLYSRLRSIEKILGVSLDSAESRTSLHTALMVVDAR
ncbi:PucR family transcriptional regulator [Streptomyces smyrnaeus]